MNAAVDDKRVRRHYVCRHRCGVVTVEPVEDERDIADRDKTIGFLAERLVAEPGLFCLHYVASMKFASEVVLLL